MNTTDRIRNSVSLRRLGLALAIMPMLPAYGAAGQDPAPDQSEFYFQTDFPAEEFVQRRAKVLEKLDDDAVALIQGAPPVRGFAMFRQSNELYYLCGVVVPRAYLLLDGRSDKVELFLPHRNRRTEGREGRELSAEDGDLLTKWTGVDAVRGLEELTDRLKGASVIYTPYSPAEGPTGSRDELRRSNRMITEDPWDGRPTREQHLRNLVEQRYPEAEVRDLTPILDPLRVIKSSREIALLRRAGQLSALALIEAVKSTRPGVMEYELDAVARYVYYVNGAQGLGYRSITAGGPNISNAHYYRNNRRLEADDMVLMDFAPDVGYYTSDIGRMWPVDGYYPPFMRELYGFVVEYHKVVLDVLRPGATVRELRDEVSEKITPVFERIEFSKPIYREAAKKLIETTGGAFSHGVGMAVHDIGRYNRGPLQPGMVFSIDPQLWVPEEDLYIRIEDTIVITEDGHENFTSLVPRELDEIEALMKEDGLLQKLPSVPAAGSNDGIAPPPDSLETDPFYTKYLSSKGLPILSSGKVADEALIEASFLVNQMLAARPDIREALIAGDVRVVVMDPTEMTTDVPEQRDMEPKDYWDRRARGLGGRITSCGEENLLNLPGDRYRGENILIHEFSHCIHGQALRRIDPDFDRKLKELFERAREKGLWKETYAMSSASEYWAEAVQSWFDCNRQSRSGEPDGVHNHVDTREELEAYDPDMAALIAETLGRSTWRYSRYIDRNPPLREGGSRP